MAEDLVVILKADAEHRVGQQFNYRSAHFEEFFFRHPGLDSVVVRLHCGAP
jgi:hypothetical protein